MPFDISSILSQDIEKKMKHRNPVFYFAIVTRWANRRVGCCWRRRLLSRTIPRPRRRRFHQKPDRLWRRRSRRSSGQNHSLSACGERERRSGNRKRWRWLSLVLTMMQIFGSKSLSVSLQRERRSGYRNRSRRLSLGLTGSMGQNRLPASQRE